MILVAHFPKISSLYQDTENRLPISVTKIRIDGGWVLWQARYGIPSTVDGRTRCRRTYSSALLSLDSCKQNGHVNVVNYVELRGLISAC